jgi:fucose permease
MLMFGIVMTTLGSVLPEIISRYAMDKTEAGSLITLLSFGVLTGSLLFGPVVDRYGYRRYLGFSATLICAGIEGIAFSSDATLLRIFVLLIGFGGGGINGASNALAADISEREKGASLSLIHMFFGIGAISVPFALGTLLPFWSSATILGMIGAAMLPPLVFITVIRYPVPKLPQGIRIPEALAMLRDRALLIFGAILFFQSGMELTISGWSAVYFMERHHITTDRAVFIFSFFWLGIIIARILLSRLLKLRFAPTIIYISLCTTITGVSMMLFAANVYLSAAGLFVIGLGIAAVFPVVLGYIGERHAGMSGTAYGVAFTMALSGGMLFPYLTGLMGQSFGLRYSLLVIPILLFVITSLFFVRPE